MTEKKLTIAFDVDGTLSQLTELTLEELGNPIRIEELTDYNDILKFFDGSLDTWRSFLREKDIRRRAEPYPDMVNAWSSLRKRHNCIIITSTSRLIDQKAMLDWISDNLDTEGGVDIHFTNKKHRVEFDMIIEDRVANAVKAVKNGRVGVIVVRPWSTKEGTKALDKHRKRLFAAHADKNLLPYLEDIIQWMCWLDH